MREIRDLTTSVSFPTIVIGEKIVTGYRPDEIRKALGL
jgi:glutaredoxin